MDGVTGEEGRAASYGPSPPVRSTAPTLTPLQRPSTPDRAHYTPTHGTPRYPLPSRPGHSTSGEEARLEDRTGGEWRS